MGFKFTALVYFIFLLVPLAAHGLYDGPYIDDQITVKKFRTHDDVAKEICRVDDESSNDCNVSAQTTKLDVVYVPKTFGDRVIAQLQSAYGKKYFSNMNTQDLFHGHMIARGPQTTYATPAAWFNDVEMVLFHAAEHEADSVWPDLLPGDEIYKEHGFERSFVGWAKGGDTSAIAAITLITPGQPLKSYAGAGTIFMEELNRSLHISEHNLYNFDGNDPWLVANSCAAGEAGCKPCEIFNMLYLWPDPNGGFIAPDGARIEIFFQCKFKDF